MLFFTNYFLDMTPKVLSFCVVADQKTPRFFVFHVEESRQNMWMY
jgi:hypothetical protein